LLSELELYSLILRSSVNLHKPAASPSKPMNPPIGIRSDDIGLHTLLRNESEMVRNPLRIPELTWHLPGILAPPLSLDDDSHRMRPNGIA
jgi:hypothetical protein